MIEWEIFITVEPYVAAEIMCVVKSKLFWLFLPFRFQLPYQNKYSANPVKTQIDFSCFWHYKDNRQFSIVWEKWRSRLLLMKVTLSLCPFFQGSIRVDGRFWTKHRCLQIWSWIITLNILTKLNYSVDKCDEKCFSFTTDCHRLL